MIPVFRAEYAAEPVVGAQWDAAIERLGGDLLQSHGWGVFKRKHGWNVEQVTASGGSRAQILFRHVGPLSQAYVPRGPVLASEAGDALELLRKIDAVCARHRAISMIVEPLEPLPGAWLELSPGFEPSSRSIQSPRTVIVDLTLDDAALLQKMRKDTRYNIGYAQRHGMVVEEVPVSDTSVDRFYSLMDATAMRHRFGIHDREYYRDFLETFGDRAVLLFARSGDDITAGLIAGRFGHSARSMYAGAQSGRNARGDAALLRFAAMQWARRHGCTTYDLGGIAPASGDPSGLQGVERFKTGFGGDIVTFPQAVERVYRPWLASVTTRLRGMLPGMSN